MSCVHLGRGVGGGCSCVLGKASRRCCVWCSGIKSRNLKERERQAQACDVHLWLALNNKTHTLIRKANKETNKGECNKNSLKLVGMKRIGITTATTTYQTKVKILFLLSPRTFVRRSRKDKRHGYGRRVVKAWVWVCVVDSSVGLLTVAACCVRRPRRVQRSSAVRMLGGVAATW